MFSKEKIEALRASAHWIHEGSWDNMLESLDGLNSRQAISIVYKRPYYSRPLYTILTGDESLRPLSIGVTAGDCLERQEKIISTTITDRRGKNGYLGSLSLATVIDFFETEGRFCLEENLYTSWCNSQEWHQEVRSHHKRWDLKTGAEDVPAIAEINKISAAVISARRESFRVAEMCVPYMYGTHIWSEVLSRKGEILATAQVLICADLRPGQAEKILKLTRSLGKFENRRAVFTNVVTFVKTDLARKRAKRAAKACAWRHYENVLGSMPLSGHAPDVDKALQLYLQYLQL